MTLPRTGALIDTARLASGLTLFAFALTHFLNHALGLWSLEAMAAAQSLRLAVTHSVPGSIALMLALVVHLALALWRIARLKTWRLPPAAIWLLATGALISVLLAPHFFEAGIGARQANAVMSYPAALSRIWPAKMPLQSALLLLVWTHGCIGLHQWLKSEPWWRRSSHVLAACAALVPAAALAGVVVAGRDVERLKGPIAFPYPRAELAPLGAHAADAMRASTLLMALALVVALVSGALARRRRRLVIRYEPGPTVFAAPGPTLLEISRVHRVPHLSVCGGKARCSTCRVRVLDGLRELEAPGEAELRLLRRIGAEPQVRLACQIRPRTTLTVRRLLNPETATPALVHGLEAAGVLRVAAVLFVDIRGFTKLAESKLAFDVVYILNAFFAEAGRAIESSGGRIDKYMGDGLMALFESADDLGAATRDALRAAAAIDASLAKVNRRLEGEIDAPLELAMGLHGGRLISGRIGYGEAAHPTVIGRVVNIASRLESLAKARGVELALSSICAEAARLDVSGFLVELADIRGLDEAFPVALVARVGDLATAVEGR